MSRYTGPKSRLCRREGLCICGRAKCSQKKRSSIPGQHGQKASFSKPSEYARQLREKQKLKRLYGVNERQLTNYFKVAAKKKEITGDALLRILETRFDNVLYRAGFAKTRNQARQIANHGHFTVNNKRVSTPSFQVKVGDKFEVREKSKKAPIFQDLDKQKFKPAAWIKPDYKKLSGEIDRDLEADDLEKVIQTNLIVEYYSK